MLNARPHRTNELSDIGRLEKHLLTYFLACLLTYLLTYLLIYLTDLELVAVMNKFIQLVGCERAFGSASDYIL